MATRCLNGGMELSEIQKLLGHSNINTTLIYAKGSYYDIKYMHFKCIE